MGCHGCGLFFPKRCEYCGAIGDLSECGGPRLQAEAKPNPDSVAADVRPDPPGAPVAVVGGHSDAEAAACVVGYNRALADSLKSAEQILDKLAKDHWPLEALAAVLKERLAEGYGRLEWKFSGDDLLEEVARVRVKADVVTRGG